MGKTEDRQVVAEAWLRYARHYFRRRDDADERVSAACYVAWRHWLQVQRDGRTDVGPALCISLACRYVAGTQNANTIGNGGRVPYANAVQAQEVSLDTERDRPAGRATGDPARLAEVRELANLAYNASTVPGDREIVLRVFVGDAGEEACRGVRPDRPADSEWRTVRRRIRRRFALLK